MSGSQVLRDELAMKRALLEQTLEAGRQYLQEEGEDKRLSTDSGDSGETGTHHKSIACWATKWLHSNFVSSILKNVNFRLNLSEQYSLDANSLEPRSGPTYVGPDLGFCLFASL